MSDVTIKEKNDHITLKKAIKHTNKKKRNQMKENDLCQNDSGQ